MTYLGYLTTTGLSMIDYRITDHYLDSTSVNGRFTAETPLQMPASLYCYQPHPDSPPVNELPVIRKGYLTFSSFNNIVKVSSSILALWGKILNRVSGARLIVKANLLHDRVARQHLEAQFAKHGIASDRLILEDYAPPPAYLESYHQIDLGLDSYPVNGGTTTCEALWMGVPVVTLVGERHMSRVGLSILSTVGLTELIAYTEEEYIQICLKLANDTSYLQDLRATLRERMQSSPLMDAATFTRSLENSYRHLWERWCRPETKN